jgi:hypothetical protein
MWQQSMATKDSKPIIYGILFLIFFDRLSWKELLVAPTPPLKITNPYNYEVSYSFFFGPIRVYK